MELTDARKLPWGNPARMRLIVAIAIAEYMNATDGMESVSRFLATGKAIECANHVVDVMEREGVDLERL